VTDTVKLRVTGLPSELYVRNRRLLDDLVHELQMIRAGEMTGLDVDPALSDSLNSILATFAGPRDVAFTTAKEALLAQKKTFDLEMELERAALPALRRVLQLLEEVEDLARRGVLLTMPAPAEIWELRRWVVQEVERQAAGADPTPFPSSDGA
jgi:type II secretory pathway component HofQ